MPGPDLKVILQGSFFMIMSVTQSSHSLFLTLWLAYLIHLVKAPVCCKTFSGMTKTAEAASVKQSFSAVSSTEAHMVLINYSQIFIHDVFYD